MKKLIFVLLMLGCGSVQADTVLYKYDAYLTSNLDSDIYGLNGATMSLLFFAESELVDGQIEVEGQVIFSDRPDGFSDVTTQMLAPQIDIGHLYGNISVTVQYYFRTGGLASFEGFGDFGGLLSMETQTTGGGANDGCGYDEYGFYLGECWEDRLPEYDEAYLWIGIGDLIPPGSSYPDVYLVSPTGYSVTAVPIPAAVWLFGSGLGLLGWFRRKV